MCPMIIFLYAFKQEIVNFQIKGMLPRGNSELMC